MNGDTDLDSWRRGVVHETKGVTNRAPSVYAGSRSGGVVSLCLSRNDLVLRNRDESESGTFQVDEGLQGRSLVDSLLQTADER
jgi:hypothetical protein